MVDDIAIEEPVERRVALDTDLGEHDDIGLILFALFDGSDNAGSIALKIAVGGVDLADGDAHEICYEICDEICDLKFALL